MLKYFKNTEVNRTWGNVSMAFHHYEVMFASSVTQHRAYFSQPLLWGLFLFICCWTGSSSPTVPLCDRREDSVSHRIPQCGSVPSMKLASQPSNLRSSDVTILVDHATLANIIKRQQRFSICTVCFEEAARWLLYCWEQHAFPLELGNYGKHHNHGHFKWYWNHDYLTWLFTDFKTFQH